MPKSSPSTASELRRRLLTYYAAWKALDMNELSPYYSKDPALLVFNDVDPIKLEGWEEFRKAEGEIMARVSHWKLAPKDVRVSAWGDVGVTTSTPILSGESKSGRKYDITMRHTAVWEKRRRSWLIIHDHWSIPWRSSNPTSAQA